MLVTEGLTTLDALIEGYRLRCKIEGKSRKTVAIYTTALNILNDFLKRDGLPTDVTLVTEHELRRFIAYLQRAEAYREHPFTKPQHRGLTGHTINCYLRAVRAFWSWLVSEEIITASPFGRIKIPKPPKKVILPFTEDQVRNLLAVIDTHSAIGFRDWTITLTLLDTGIRVTELANLGLEDVNLNQRSLRVCGKGAKERIVPIGARVQRAMAKYANRYRPHSSITFRDKLFLNRAGNPVTANCIEARIRNYGRKVGISGVRCSPHTFRHTFAIFFLRNGGDIFSLQRILGHESLDMVRNYVNLAQQDVQAAHARCSPVDNLELKEARKHGTVNKARHGR
jgi:site-specific recombinase XerD